MFRISTRSATTWSINETPAAVLLIILLGGCINGYAVHITEAMIVPGMASLFLGLSPFDLIVVFVATSLILEATEPPDPSRQTSEASIGIGWADAFAVIALLIPSSTVSWCVVAAYAGYRAFQSSGPRQVGLMFFIVLALCSLWSSVGMKVFGVTITSLEAAVVATLLSTFKDGVVHTGNVVGNPEHFTLIVMAACSTLDGLPKALLGLTAVLWLTGALSSRTLLTSGTALVAIYTIANFARLTVMATSQDLYQLAHGPIGAGIFDGLIVISVFALSMVWTNDLARTQKTATGCP
ncbi:MAG: hypothetical protein AAFO75_08735 [Pseudomonadota bacterium]